MLRTSESGPVPVVTEGGGEEPGDVVSLTKKVFKPSEYSAPD
jgi:hypothetical protein